MIDRPPVPDVMAEDWTPMETEALSRLLGSREACLIYIVRLESGLSTARSLLKHDGALIDAVIDANPDVYAKALAALGPPADYKGSAP